MRIRRFISALVFGASLSIELSFKPVTGWLPPSLHTSIIVLVFVVSTVFFHAGVRDFSSAG